MDFGIRRFRSNYKVSILNKYNSSGGYVLELVTEMEEMVVVF